MVLVCYLCGLFRPQLSRKMMLSKWFLFTGKKICSQSLWIISQILQCKKAHPSTHLALAVLAALLEERPPAKGSFKIWAEPHRMSTESKHVYFAVSASSQIFSMHLLSLNKIRKCQSLGTSENLYLHAESTVQCCDYCCCRFLWREHMQRVGTAS